MKGRADLGLEAGRDVGWEAASEAARGVLEGAERRFVRGANADIEIALLDWGGEGDLVLLHHANGFCGATLAPIANALSGRFRVVCVDARGHGHSTSVPPGETGAAYAWSALAADLRAVVQELLATTGRDRVELAIGHSFGGALCLEAAEREPSLFGRLLLCDPVILDPPASGGVEVPSRGPDLASGARRRRNRFDSLAEAYSHFQGRGIFADFTPEALALYVAEGVAPGPDGGFALRCSPDVEGAIFASGERTDLFADAPKLSAEVRFIHALRGNFSRERYDALAARIPSASVASLDLGHLFPMEEPKRVVDLVEGWLSSSSPTA